MYCIALVKKRERETENEKFEKRPIQTDQIDFQ